MRTIWRKTCRVCGEAMVAHTAYDQPYEQHRRGKRHKRAMAMLAAGTHAAVLGLSAVPDKLAELNRRLAEVKPVGPTLTSAQSMEILEALKQSLLRR